MNADEMTVLELGPDRDFVGDGGEDYRKLQLQLDKFQRVVWIQSLAPWEVMATFTFRWEASMASAIRTHTKFMRRHPGVSYVYCVEPNPGRCGYHLHSLWADCKGISRRDEWQEWWTRYGRARIEPVRSAGDVSGYASKYLTKADAWFDVVLQWHRRQALHQVDFKLRPGEVIA